MSSAPPCADENMPADRITSPASSARMRTAVPFLAGTTLPLTGALPFTRPVKSPLNPPLSEKSPRMPVRRMPSVTRSASSDRLSGLPSADPDEPRFSGNLRMSMLPEVTASATDRALPRPRISTAPSSQPPILTLENRAISSPPSGLNATFPAAVNPGPVRVRRGTEGTAPRITSASSRPAVPEPLRQPSSGMAKVMPRRSDVRFSRPAPPRGRVIDTVPGPCPVTIDRGRPRPNSSTAACDRVT